MGAAALLPVQALVVFGRERESSTIPRHEGVTSFEGWERLAGVARWLVPGEQATGAGRSRAAIERGAVDEGRGISPASTRVGSTAAPSRRVRPLALSARRREQTIPLKPLLSRIPRAVWVEMRTSGTPPGMLARLVADPACSDSPVPHHVLVM